jgi:hypothetical protein
VTLPQPGTPELEALQREALQLGMAALRERPEQLADALYLVYSAFRLRFLEERGLLDIVPGHDTASAEALQDARVLERYVAESWGESLLRAFAVDR